MRQLVQHHLGVEVLAVGPGVTNVKPGDRCSVEPYINCQTCYSCRRGFTNCCENHKTLGVMCDGGMAEKFLLPARKLHVSLPRAAKAGSELVVRTRRYTSIRSPGCSFSGTMKLR